MLERLSRVAEYSEVAMSLSRQKSREFIDAVKNGVMNRRLQSIAVAGTELRRWGQGLQQVKTIDLPEGISDETWQMLSFRGADDGFVFELSGISKEGIQSFSLIYHDIEGCTVAATTHDTIHEVSILEKALSDPMTITALSRMPAPL